ncbi:MAG: nucleotidyltransferase [Bacteroidetes bacterium]|nr:nucleotidyltransferase [Bacteroidota bacterium]
MRKSENTALDPGLLRDADLKAKGMIGLGDAGRPFLDYLLANADAAGYREAVIVVGERDRSIREYYGSAGRGDRFLGMSLFYAVQPVPSGRSKPLGTADALLHGLESRPDWAGAKVTVCNSDNLYSVEALRCLRDAEEPCAMIDYDRDALSFEPGRVQHFAVIEKDSDGYVRSILEKPSLEEIARAAGPDGRVGVNMNAFRLSYDLIMPCLRRVPLHPVRQEKELPTAVMMMIAETPRAVRAYPRAEHVPDLTDKTDIVQVQEYLRNLHDENPSRQR